MKYKDRRIIWKLYRDEIAVVQCGVHTQEAKIEKGVRQGCSLSPTLFNAYIQKGLDEVRERMQNKGRGVVIHGEKIDMLRFADDIAVVADNEEELTTMLKEMESVFNSKYGMKINKGKTKILSISKNGTQANIMLEGTPIENVNEFTYLGSKITSDAKSKRDIQSRICQAKIAFNKKKRLFTSNNLNITLRKKLLKTFVWSVMLYGSETWTMGKPEHQKIEAFEMWCYRRMLKISWVEKVTNEQVLRRLSEEMSLLKTLQKRRNTWIGHVMRHEGLLEIILEGLVEGKNCRGRPRLQYLNQVMGDMNCPSYNELKRMANDRALWRDAANQPMG